VITFAVLDEIVFILDNYLKSQWGTPLAGRLGQMAYPAIFTRPALPGGTWIFTAQERLTAAGREMAVLAYDAIARSGGRALNHPSRVVERYELLRSLNATGANRFRAARVSEYEGGLRFPVFVREENEHSGSLTRLLRGESELRVALAYLRLRGFAAEELLIVEFCDTADSQGRFRKYSAYFLDGEVLPRHLHVSSDWVAKSADSLLDETFAAEEVRYIVENPHESYLRHVFHSARIEYGRADYGMLGDEPQIWEINTAPTISTSAHPRRRTPELLRFRALERPGQAHFHERFRRALEAIDSQPETKAEVPLPIPSDLVARWRAELRDQARRTRRRRMLSRLGRFQAMRALRTRAEPAILRLLERSRSRQREDRVFSGKRAP